MANAIKERIFRDDLPNGNELVEEKRLVIINELGMKHKDKSRKNANCYHTVQLWADGKVSAVCGPLSTEGTGGSVYLHAVDLSLDEARIEFNKAIEAQKKKGYLPQQQPGGKVEGLAA